MIRTRFGTPVKVSAFDERTGLVTFVRIGTHDAPDQAHILEFRADGGIEEIQAASHEE